MTKRTRTASQAELNRNKARQAYMKAAGYGVPQDGSWGPYQQSIWNKLSTRHKQYDTTLMGLANAAYDKWRGLDTYTVDPLAQSSVRTYNPDEIDWSKTRKSQSKVVNALSDTYGPIVAAATAPSVIGAFLSAPIATATTIAGGATGGYAADKLFEAFTGKDISTYATMHTPLTPALGEMLNPGYLVGGAYGNIYGNFVENNLANKGRYTLNYLNPVSYKGHWLDFPLTISAPFYRNPPTFYNGRKPSWYVDYARKEGIDAAEQRFQNGLVWANIPEKEAAHPMYIQNKDGSYRLTPEGIGYKGYPADALPEQTTKAEADFFTKSGIGGEHSDYTKLGDWMGAKLMQFKDEQKLNPQWLITDPVKNLVEKVPGGRNSKAWEFLDWLGGKSMTGLVGYKPFTIKQNYIHTGNKVYPLYEDPNNTSNIPNFTLLGD